jgi:membrane-associated phospholipid phosphatase
MKLFSQLISWIFLPLFMPVYALLLTMYIPSLEQGFFQNNTIYLLDPRLKLALLGIFFLFSFLAPAISLVILKRNNKISNLEIDNRSERSIPILVTAIYSLILAWFLMVKTPPGILPPAVYLLPAGGTVAIVLVMLITRFDKISLHALGVGMLMGFLIAYFQTQAQFQMGILFLTTIVSGVVMSARLFLGKHNLRQCLMGYFLGILVIYLTIKFLG